MVGKSIALIAACPSPTIVEKRRQNRMWYADNKDRARTTVLPNKKKETKNTKNYEQA